jgi:hypothetical protein
MKPCIAKCHEKLNKVLIHVRAEGEKHRLVARGSRHRLEKDVDQKFYVLFK